MARGDEVTALSRDADARPRALAGARRARWRDPRASPRPAGARAARRGRAPGSASRSPSAGPTTPSGEIRDSRVLGTRNLVAALRELPRQRPRVLVSQSAIGWYGPRGDEPVDESDAAAGDDFLAERGGGLGGGGAARPRSSGMRRGPTRTGVVLSEAGGALEKMLPPFKLGVGGPVAGGRQYVPWIHLDDVVGRDPLRARRRSAPRARQPHRAGAGDQQGAVEGARAGAAPARARAGARPGGEAALRRDGLDRHHGRCAWSRGASRSWATRSAARSWKRRCARLWSPSVVSRNFGCTFPASGRA